MSGEWFHLKWKFLDREVCRSKMLVFFLSEKICMQTSVMDVNNQM